MRPWLVDMLCLDKTGTITQGKMQVEAVLPLTATYGEETIASILTSYIAHSEDKNPTAQAIRQRFQGQVAYPMLSNLPLLKRPQVGSNGIGRFGEQFS